MLTDTPVTWQVLSVMLLLHVAQMSRLRTTNLDYNAAKALGAQGKDADMSPFSASTKLLEPRGASRPPT